MIASPPLPTLPVPETYNYVATFLTLACNLDCSYCINLHEDTTGGRKRILTEHMTGEEWVAAIDRIDTAGRMPITLQGGEPTVYKDFYHVVAKVKEGVRFDLLTNLQFDPAEFARKVPKERFDRKAPYAPIRVSYHPGQNKIEELIPKMHALMDAGFRVGLYGVLHPALKDHILEVEAQCLKQGIDFRTKEYLGVFKNEANGVYRYPQAIEGHFNKYCDCKTTELLMSPSGHVYRCHSDLYEARPAVGHILDPKFRVHDIFRPCYVYGHCNPCDIKVKTNRFQQYGHTSCEIEKIRDLTPEEEERRKLGDNGVLPPGPVTWKRDRRPALEA